MLWMHIEMSSLLNLIVRTFSCETTWLMTKYCYVLKSCVLGGKKKIYEMYFNIFLINFNVSFILKMWKRNKNNNGEGDGGFNNPSSIPILISLICPIWFPIIHHYLCQFQFLSYNMNIKRHMLLFILFFELLTYTYMTTWSHKLWTNPYNNHHCMSIYWIFVNWNLLA